LARKKVVLVIVEGSSDDTALGLTLNQVLDQDSVYIHIMHGDITTRNGINSKNIISKIGTVVKEYAKSQHYTAKQFKQIIHIVDTDGTYIPDDNVIGDTTCQNPMYESDGIHTKDAKGIIDRNEKKRDNLFRLRSCGDIWAVPYSVYYMSCNLDHVLHDKRNSTVEEKENDAYAFAKRFKNNSDGFVKFICESSFSVKGDYKGSWDYIENGMNSIQRYTNLPICIQEENVKMDD
jgi:hypothetical protein